MKCPEIPRAESWDAVETVFRDAPALGLGQSWLAEAEPAFRPGRVRIGWFARRFCYFGELVDDFPITRACGRNEPLWQLGDVLIPAALEARITGENGGRLRCKILAEAANGPTTASGDAVLRDSDIFVLPDVLCNAGGVTVSYFEWVQNRQNFSWTEIEINDRLYRILERAFQDVLGFAKRNALWMRDAALAIGIKKVLDAKKARGLYP